MTARPKLAYVRSKRIRDSARDEECTVRLSGWCNRRTDTTVFAHANSGHGKGMGIKASDDAGAYACERCHTLYDRQCPLPGHLDRWDVELAFARAMEATREALVSKGLLQS